MSPKSRNKENKPLPSRWRYKHGAYYYRVPKGLESQWDGKQDFRLGKTLSEAHRVFASRVKSLENITRMEQLCDRYEIEVVPKKKPATQKSNHYSFQRIRPAFAGNNVADIEPVHIYQYRDHIGKTESQKKANLDLEVLSHMFTMSIEWGIRIDHPMTNKKVVKFSLKPKDRYVEDWELKAFLSVASNFLKAYLKLKGLTGLDKGDLLSIKSSGIGKDRLTVAARKKTAKAHKNNRDRFFPYFDKDGSPTGIKEAIDEILAIKGRPHITQYLFCTTHGRNRGRPYIKEDGATSGFDSMWQRTMTKALKETDLVEKFTEHDLRAKVASDIETDEQAQRQLDHSSVQTTRKTYRRKAIEMPVAKGFGEQEQ